MATSQGSTGPANWQTYCWLDLSSYNHAAASSTSGQAFNYTLPDGTVMTFNLRVTGTALTSATSPSWTGAAVGNTAFLGIGGRPILYQTGAGTSEITIRNIAMTPPPGSGAITAYMFVGADAESTNESESLRFQTNGGAWSVLDRAGPISGNAYPTISGAGTTAFTQTGVGGTVGAYIVGSTTPTQVTTRMVGGGMQGVMFAVRFASIRLTMQIANGRANSADQFKFDITSTSGGTTLATGTSTGSSLGPFAAASLTTASALPITLSQVMTGGSVNSIDHYRSTLSCTNSAVSSTPLPSGTETTSYNFGALQFGDNVACTFTNQPYPHLTLRKVMGSGGRRFPGDQFTLNLREGAAVRATTTTTGSVSTVGNGSTPTYQGAPGTTYTFEEAAAGTTVMAQYTAAMACSNSSSGTGTALPNTPGGSVTARMGDVITCTITNTRRGNNATLSVIKSSAVISDPVNNAVNPFAIPGAVVRYTFHVANSGNLPTDSNSVVLIDQLPPQVEIGTAAAPAFSQGAPTSTLAFSAASDLRFSNAVSPPASFAACNYTPVAAYDPAVRYVCLNPKGAMAASSGTPPNFSLSVNVRVK